MQEALRQLKGVKNYLTLNEVQETVSAVNKQVQEEQDSKRVLFLI